MYINTLHKSLISFSLLLFSSSVVLSQNTEIDSVENELQVYQEKDSTRVNLLNKLGYSYRWGNFDKAVFYLQESYSIADSIGYVKGKARSLSIKGTATAIQTNNKQGSELFLRALELYKNIGLKSGIADTYESIGRFYYMNGDQTRAIEYFHQSLKNNEEINDNGKVFILLNRIGWSYIQTGNYSEAMTYYKRSLNIGDSINDKTTLSHCYSDMAIIYSYQGNYPLSIEYFTKALMVARENADSISMGNAFGNMGPVYDHLENYHKAIECYEKSIIYLNNTNKEATASNLNNLGLVHVELKEYDRAYKYLEDALKTYQEINVKGGEALTLNNIGYVYLMLNDYKAAYPFFMRSKKINMKIDNLRGLCYSYLNISKVFNHQKKYDKAINNALKSIELADSLNLLEYKRDASKLLSEIYKSTDNYRKALEIHQQYKTLNDSLFNKKNIEKITQIEYEYKYKQQLDSANIRELNLTQTVLSTTQELKKSQKSSFIAIIIILIISLISGSIILIMKLRHVNAVNQNILMEQKLLRSQMTPHFIFNSLSVLQGMILNNEKNKSVAYLSEFSKLMRTILENSRHKAVLLSKELSAIDSYMQLQNLDTNPPYDYSLRMAQSLNIDSFKIPPMLIQPFIENAIEHAFVGKKEDKKIAVEISVKDEVLKCIISDNGIGIRSNNHQVKKDKKPLAATITSERLKMLSADFGVQGSVEIQNRESFGEKGTLVTLTIPYKIDSTQ